MNFNVQWRKFPWLDSDSARARWMYLLGLAYLLVGYLGTNEIAALNPWSRPALPIETALDRAIPFVPWTVFFYVMYYVILLTPLLLARDAIALTRLTIAQTAMNTFAYFVFLVFPTPIARPPAPIEQGPFFWTLDTLFRADHPYNTFPSLHVAQACILAFFFWSYRTVSAVSAVNLDSRSLDWKNQRLWIFHAVSAILIALSALMIKQHYVADAVAGFFLSWLMARVFFKRDT